MRAKAYFDKLSTIGDCPIIKEILADDRKVLLDNSKRQPQHKVARFILEDLDKAIELLKEDAPGGRNRISKNVAYLFRSRELFSKEHGSNTTKEQPLYLVEAVGLETQQTLLASILIVKSITS